MTEPNRDHVVRARVATTTAMDARQRRVHEESIAARRLAELERKAGSGDPSVERARAEHTASLRALDEARKVLAGAVDALSGSLTAWLPPSAGGEWQALDGKTPAVLLPVRLETRFTTRRDGVGELLVRVYPDVIFVDSHDAALTEQEAEAARTYWGATWNGETEADAWRELLRRMPAPRAAWVVQAMTPENLAEHPDGEPRFPPVEPRTGAWDRAPRTRVLPDRWMLVGYRGGMEVLRAAGGPIREPLALGFDPHGSEDAVVDVSGDGLALDDELMWAVDFERALDAGMALRVSVTSADRRLGFDRVFVVGVKASLSPEESAIALERLLAAHHYTGGLELIAQGTPTNNTDESRAGYPPADPDGQLSFGIERGEPLDRSNGDGARLTAALGVRSAVLAHVGGADRREQDRSEAMNRAVFPVVLGYFLRELMAPHISDGAMAETLSHFVHHVRGRGPLPALRVRRQPYGVLPVSSLGRWTAGATSLERELPPLLRRLTATWLEAAERAPRVGRSGDADADLLEILAQHPSSREVRVRTAQGPAWQRSLLAFLGLDAEAWSAERMRLTSSVMAGIGHPGWDPRILHVSFADAVGRYRFPLVAPAPLSETRGLDPDYVRWVREATLAELRDETWPGGARPPQCLLYRVLRHARLDEVARAALDVHVAHGVPAAERLEREEVGVTGERSPTRWQRLLQPIEALSGTTSIGEFLLVDRQREESRPVREHADALAALERLPTAELDRLFSESLDLGSHRLDAWITSLAARRLADLRARIPVGVHLGAFGWVEDLRPAAGRRASDGHILAPSLDHAASAAVLRSGYLTRNVAGGGAFAIDLSSARIREGLAVLDGARDGEPAGAILGGRFERALREHPRRLARFIEPLRRRFPLIAGKGNDAAPPELLAVRAVVDGLAMRRAFLSDELDLDHPDFSTGDATRDVADRSAVRGELEALDRTVDSVADLLLAESVHQAVAGSVTGAGATLDSMARGTLPPDPAIARQVATGVPIYHRVAWVLGDATLPPGWGAPTPRSLAEPRVDAWLGRQLGDPRRVRCRVTIPAPSGPPRVEEVSLADLGLRPVDVIALADVRPEEARPPSELDARVIDAAGAASSTLPVAVDYSRGSAPGGVGFGELFEVAGGLRDVVSRCRPLVASDLVTPANVPTVPQGTSDPDAHTRADGAALAITAASTALDEALTEGDAAALRTALRAVALFGVANAYPLVGREVEQALAAKQELSRRLAAAGDPASPAIAKVAAVFGPAFAFLPRCQPPRADELAGALAASSAIVPDPSAPIRWLAEASRVRSVLDGWRRVTILVEALGAATTPLVLAQLPVRTDGRWVALPHGDTRPVAGTYSLALLDDGIPPDGKPWAGLVLDEWAESIPDPESTTGLAFHHDTPGAEAPQCILIAVPPRIEATWHVDDILSILAETMDMARMRAVDGELLGHLGQLLPTTYLTANAADDTISTTFTGALVADRARE